jgi:hypothetical protein
MGPSTCSQSVSQSGSQSVSQAVSQSVRQHRNVIVDQSQVHLINTSCRQYQKTASLVNKGDRSEHKQTQPNARALWCNKKQDLQSKCHAAAGKHNVVAMKPSVRCLGSTHPPRVSMALHARVSSAVESGKLYTLHTLKRWSHVQPIDPHDPLSSCLAQSTPRPLYNACSFSAAARCCGADEFQRLVRS